jgi:hypothetical protein
MEATLKNQGSLAVLYLQQRKQIKLDKNRAEKARNKKPNLIKL